MILKLKIRILWILDGNPPESDLIKHFEGIHHPREGNVGSRAVPWNPDGYSLELCEPVPMWQGLRSCRIISWTETCFSFGGPEKL